MTLLSLALGVLVVYEDRCVGFSAVSFGSVWDSDGVGLCFSRCLVVLVHGLSRGFLVVVGCLLGEVAGGMVCGGYVVLH